MAATTPTTVQRTYLGVTLLTTLGASLIWGLNTLFLLDAGLSNLEAFAANAFFTAGMVIFEIPTGVVADLRGRRLSYLLGTAVLAVGTAVYVLMWMVQAPFWAWALASVVLGLGFTFFSGAVEAWLVDALHATGWKGDLEVVFGRGQAVEGVAMLTGSVLGGLIAQATNLGVPYLVRAGLFVLTLVVAAVFMRDLGFTPERGARPTEQVRRLLHDSVQAGLGHRPVRWMMLTSPFLGAVTVYVFYAAQPYLLELYGDPSAYTLAGLAAALVAGSQIVGGLLASRLRRLFTRRTTMVGLAVAIGAVALLTSGLVQQLVVVIVMLSLWSLGFAALMPVRQAYLNALIPANRRATVLSFDSLLGSAGGVVLQPALGRVADVSGYATTMTISGIAQAAALPFVWLARRERQPADTAVQDPEPADDPTPDVTEPDLTTPDPGTPDPGTPDPGTRSSGTP